MISSRRPLRSVFALGFAWLVAFAPRAAAQTETVVYDFVDVWLDPVISHPWEDPQQMTGSFQWTYTPGDFANGTGELLTLYLPWWGSDLTDLNFTSDTGSIEITLGGNYHDRGVDVSLFLVESMTPDQPSTIDTSRSAFDIQVGVSHQGEVISGSVVPRTAPACLAADGENLTLHDDTVLDTQVFEVCDTIQVGPNYQVSGPNGKLTLRAGNAVIFLDGASVGTGGELTVEIDASLVP